MAEKRPNSIDFQVYSCDTISSVLWVVFLEEDSFFHDSVATRGET